MQQAEDLAGDTSDLTLLLANVLNWDPGKGSLSDAVANAAEKAKPHKQSPIIEGILKGVMKVFGGNPELVGNAGGLPVYAIEPNALFPQGNNGVSLGDVIFVKKGLDPQTMDAVIAHEAGHRIAMDMFPKQGILQSPINAYKMMQAGNGLDELYAKYKSGNIPYQQYLDAYDAYKAGPVARYMGSAPEQLANLLGGLVRGPGDVELPVYNATQVAPTTPYDQQLMGIINEALQRFPSTRRFVP